MSMVMGNVIVNVMESDAVFWWATIFCTLTIVVRHNAASVTSLVLCGELLEVW